MEDIPFKSVRDLSDTELLGIQESIMEEFAQRLARFEEEEIIPINVWGLPDVRV